MKDSKNIFRLIATLPVVLLAFLVLIGGVGLHITKLSEQQIIDLDQQALGPLQQFHKIYTSLSKFKECILLGQGIEKQQAILERIDHLVAARVEFTGKNEKYDEYLSVWYMDFLGFKIRSAKEKKTWILDKTMNLSKRIKNINTFIRADVEENILEIQAYSEKMRKVLLILFSCAFFLGIALSSLINRRVKQIVKILYASQTDQKKLILELKQSQFQMVHSEKLASIGELAAGVAHEINNPLAILSSNMDSMIDFLDTSIPEVQNCIDTHESSIARIAKIRGSLRYLARQDNDDSEAIEVHLLINEIYQMLKGIYQNDSIEFSIDLSAKSSMVKGNLGKLQQIILNLTSNARDAVEDSNIRKIEILTTDTEKELLISIKDTGCGIIPENMARIFDSFYTTKPVGKGTGIGLSLVANFIKEMAGEIGVESTKGQGTKFLIRLPLCSQIAVQSENKIPIKSIESTHATKLPLLSGRVLIVEDEPLLRNLTSVMAKSFGFDVAVAENGKIALEKLKDQTFDCILTDIQMPVLSGDALIRQLNEQGSQIPIIVITGGVNATELVKKAFAMATLVLSKPVPKLKLYESIAKCTATIKPAVVEPTKGTHPEKIKILLIDDEPAMLDITKKILTILEYSVETASNGNAMLQAMSKERFDIAILDFNMPGLSGPELIAEANHIDDQMAIIVASGDSPDEVLDTCAKQNVFIEAALAKPYRKNELSLKIKQILDKKRAQAA